MTKPDIISIVEPQMHGVHHAPHNAAVLHAAVLAHPEQPVSFSGFADHVDEVRAIVQDQAPEIASKVDWTILRNLTGSNAAVRWLESRRLLRSILNGKKRVLFTSLSRMQIAQVQGLSKHAGQIRVILHGDIERILSERKEKFPQSLASLTKILSSPQPSNMGYLLLGEPIKANVPSSFVNLLKSSAVIDHPYHFPPREAKTLHGLTLGIFGNSGDGVYLEEVARKVKERSPEVRFVLVGFVSDQAAVDRLSGLVEGVSQMPITREEFIARSRTLTHSLWLSGNNSHRLRSSGTFFDALAHGLPIIFTANSFVDYYHFLSPGIGTRCQSLEESVAAILALRLVVTEKIYSDQQDQIYNFRERFTPQSLAARLPDVLRW